MRDHPVRMTLRKVLLVFSAVLAGLSGADRTGAFSYFLSDGEPVVWVGNQSVRDLSPTTFPPGSVAEAHILGAMGLWNLVPSCAFEYTYFPLDQDYPIDHFDGFNDTAAAPASEFDPGVLAFTVLVNDGPNWFDMDILFHENAQGAGYTFDPNPDCQVVNNPIPDHGYSFLLIATHELGHALGLGHDPIGTEPPGSPWFIGTMNPSYPGGGPVGQQNIIEVHTDDRNGARFLYPTSGPAGAPVVDLAVANQASSVVVGKSAAISFTPSSAFPADEVLARSVIENFGTTSEWNVRQGFYLSTDSTIEVTDTYLGGLRWDIAFRDAFEFDVFIPLPSDLPAGTYYLGSILDDLDEVAEAYEDNNAVVYCGPLTVAQLAPVVHSPGQRVVPCDTAYVSSSQSVTLPLNMGPVTWSLDSPPPGMTIHPSTGVIRWIEPVYSQFLYTIDVRATNGAGTASATLFLGVEASPPELMAIPDHIASCQPEYISPAPSVTVPRCMEPVLAWSLLDVPDGMTLDPVTGRATWRSPIPASTPYNVTLAAVNAAGSGTTSWRLSVIGGDMNGDGAVDRNDVLLLMDCLAGPVGTTEAGCTCADLDGDGNIDLADFSLFQSAFSH